MLEPCNGSNLVIVFEFYLFATLEPVSSLAAFFPNQTLLTSAKVI